MHATLAISHAYALVAEARISDWKLRAHYLALSNFRASYEFEGSRLRFGVVFLAYAEVAQY